MLRKISPKNIFELDLCLYATVPSCNKIETYHILICNKTWQDSFWAHFGLSLTVKLQKKKILSQKNILSQFSSSRQIIRKISFINFRQNLKNLTLGSFQTSLGLKNNIKQDFSKKKNTYVNATFCKKSKKFCVNFY